jgi:hypothetical protein
MATILAETMAGATELLVNQRRVTVAPSTSAMP